MTTTDELDIFIADKVVCQMEAYRDPEEQTGGAWYWDDSGQKHYHEGLTPWSFTMDLGLGFWAFEEFCAKYGEYYLVITPRPNKKDEYIFGEIEVSIRDKSGVEISSAYEDEPANPLCIAIKRAVETIEGINK